MPTALIATVALMLFVACGRAATATSAAMLRGLDQPGVLSPPADLRDTPYQRWLRQKQAANGTGCGQERPRPILLPG